MPDQSLALPSKGRSTKGWVAQGLAWISHKREVHRGSASEKIVL
jgi:hypothetical protein